MGENIDLSELLKLNVRTEISESHTSINSKPQPKLAAESSKLASEIRTVTLMLTVKISVYPNGNMFVGKSKAWINECKSQPKKKSKEKKEIADCKVEKEEVY